MLEISLHLLDLIENGLMAGADLIEVAIREDPILDQMRLRVQDNGHGMAPSEAARALDPFYTTRTTRQVGLGLSLMQANARSWGGDLHLVSRQGEGTQVDTWFQRSHIDRPPLGDWPQTLAGLIMSRPGVNFVYSHQVGPGEFELDTRELRVELGEVPLTDPAVISFIRDEIAKALARLQAAP